MKIVYFIILISFISPKATSQVIKELNKEEFQSLVDSHNKKKVISFWASWCSPCMEELPYFSQFKQEHPDIEVILINVDFKKDVLAKVGPIANNPLYKDCKIMRVGNLKPDDWMLTADESWDGAIPATISFNGAKRNFVSGKFDSYSDLLKFYNNK